MHVLPEQYSRTVHTDYHLPLTLETKDGHTRIRRDFGHDYRDLSTDQGIEVLEVLDEIDKQAADSRYAAATALLNSLDGPTDRLSPLDSECLTTLVNDYYFGQPRLVHVDGSYRALSKQQAMTLLSAWSPIDSDAEKRRFYAVSAAFVGALSEGTRFTSAASPGPRWSPGGIRLTDLYTPVRPGRVHPQADEVCNQVRVWTTQHLAPLGTPARLVRTMEEVLQMCSYLYPDADPEGLTLVTMLNVLQFLHDDVYDLPTGSGLPDAAAQVHALRSSPGGLTEVMDAMHAILVDPMGAVDHIDLPPGLPESLLFLPALGDIARALHRYGRRDPDRFPVWLEQFVGSLRRFSSAHRGFDSTGMTTTAAADLAVARNGMHHTVDALELANGSFLAPADRQRPVIRALREHVAAVGSYLNQVISVEKEVVQEGATDNIVDLLMVSERLTLRQAAQRVADLAQHHTNAIEHLADRVRTADPDLDRYVERLQLMTAGCWNWQLHGTTRYASPTSPFAELLATRAAAT